MSYDEYTTWGENGRRYLDEDAIRRDFSNAGVSYNGDYSEFVEMSSGTGVEYVNELRVKHAIDRERNNRNMETAFFQEMAAAQRRSQGIYLYVNQVPVDIYIPEFDAYDSVYLFHTGDSCRHTNDPKWLGPLQSQDHFFEYTQKRLSEGRHMLPCPFCDWGVYQDSSDPHFLPLGRAIRYTVEHGHPMRRKAQKKVFLEIEKERTFELWKGRLSDGGYFSHDPANPNCSLRKNVERVPLGSDADVMAFVKAHGSKSGKPIILCPECFEEKYVEAKILRKALIAGARCRGKITKEGCYLLQDTHVYPLRFPNGAMLQMRFFHPLGCDCNLERDARLLGPFEDFVTAFNSMDTGMDPDGVRNMPCLSCYADTVYEVKPEFKALYVPVGTALVDYLDAHPIAEQKTHAPLPKTETSSNSQATSAYGTPKPHEKTECQNQKPSASSAHYIRNENNKLIPVDMELLGYLAMHVKTTLFSYKGDTIVRVSARVYLPSPPPGALTLQTSFWLYGGPEPFDRKHQVDDYELRPIPDHKNMYYFGVQVLCNRRLKKGTYKVGFLIVGCKKAKSGEITLKIQH